MGTTFNNIREILNFIDSNKDKRKVAKEIALAYIYEEEEEYCFENNLINGYGFFFDFFMLDSNVLSNNSFNNIFQKLSNVEEKMIEEKRVLKEIIYEDELNVLNYKYETNKISKEVLLQQKDKILNS